jgi:two-component system KDP operon response regulator KdpE
VKGQAEVLRTLRAILATLQDGASPSPFSDLGWGIDRNVRTRQRQKSVLVVDDDDASRRAAAAAFSAAHVPVRAVADGNSAIAAIAEDKPDVVVLELGLADPMGGKDVINMIKATMEWVDVPIVLHTRVPIESHKEARTVHGADDFVFKGEGSLDTLVARVIQTFQRDQGS